LIFQVGVHKVKMDYGWALVLGQVKWQDLI